MNLIMLSSFEIVMLLQLSLIFPIRCFANHSHPNQGKRIVCSFPNWAVHRTSKTKTTKYSLHNTIFKLLFLILKTEF
jgi:hypothetical protein